MALTKEKLITHLETQLGIGRQESRQIVERLLKIMKDTLSRRDDLLISGFGKFSVRQKKARRGRNPKTKERITLAARKVLVFKASGVLRKRINEGFEFPD
jgi:integration host factor subunit alpha